MSLRDTDIARRLGEWMERYAIPQHLRDKPQAAQAEAESLARILCKMAPRDDYAPFLNRVFDGLDYQLKHRVWPTSAEIGAVCANLRRAPKTDGAEPAASDPLVIVARRMARGETVGEGYLYGRAACGLIAGRHVDEATMRAYRSGAFLARREAYGEAAALAWEAEAKARHEAAKTAFKDRTPHHGLSPDFSINHFGGEAA